VIRRHHQSTGRKPGIKDRGTLNMISIGNPKKTSPGDFESTGGFQNRASNHPSRARQEAVNGDARSEVDEPNQKRQ
jgi:hypothetical protein